MTITAVEDDDHGGGEMTISATDRGPEEVAYRRLEPPVDEAFGSMTFPAFRHMLSLEPTVRHPDQGDERVVLPLAVGAWHGDEPVGLVLADRPTEEQREDFAPKVQSLYVVPEFRRRGVGTGLMATMEELLAELGHPEVHATYMTGKRSVEAVETILEKRGWTPPETRTVTLRFTPEQALQTRWFGKVDLPEDDYEIFPWTELTDEERARLKRSNAESRWIAEGLEPWRHDHHGFDPISSLGLRYRGEVVGWVVNHRVDEETVRFTCSFMGRGLGRLARILPLYTASIRRIREAGIGNCLFVTPVSYRNMVAFVKRRCAPWASFFGETKGTKKELTRS